MQYADQRVQRVGLQHLQCGSQHLSRNSEASIECGVLTRANYQVQYEHDLGNGAELHIYAATKV
jgi:hypothetical protein